MVNRTPQAQLSDLLLSLFSAGELRRWIRFLPDGDALVRSLPSSPASPIQLATEAVHVLDRHGAINDDFFVRLVDERPGRSADIHTVRRQFDYRHDVDEHTRDVPAVPTPAVEIPRIVVLYDASAQQAVDTLRKLLESWVSKAVITLDTIYIDEWSPDLPSHSESLCLLLLTANLLARPETHDQLRELTALHRTGTQRLVPVLLSPTRWRTTVLGGLSPLPGNGLPISSWADSDAGWAEVIHGISRALPLRSPLSAAVTTAAKLPTGKPIPSPAAVSPPMVRPIDHIFRTNGPPDVNFVAPAQLPDLRIRMRFMGDGLVVEGPSGIGKTTATRQALLDTFGVDDLDTLIATGKVLWHSSTNDDDIGLRSVLAAGHTELRGHLVIDDFHRLERGLQAKVADLIKLLADGGRNLAKVVVIGINPVGTSLVRDFPDLAGRFTVVSMSKQPDEKIEELIIKGEQAANISFDRRPQFVEAARGSFFTAQLLCLEAAIREGIDGTQPSPRVIVTPPGGVVLDQVHARLNFKYHEPLLLFASYDEHPPPRGACLALLWLLTQEPDNTVSLVTARVRYPSLAPAFDWLLGSKLSALFAAHPRLRELFFYNRDAGVLSAEDPQLDFYLRNINWPALARDSGHTALEWDPQQGFERRAAAPPRVANDTPSITSARLGLPRSRILHLSDLHFGTESQAVQWYGQLLADLRGELACDQLDAVILSGDITNRAASDEFAAASHFLRDFKDDFRLAPDQFILVPGNHDLSWTVSRKAYRPMRRADFVGALDPGTFIDNGEYIEVPDEAERRDRFKPFADFYYAVRYEAYPLDYEYQATIQHFPDKRLLILGLNSAWALDHAFTTRADINSVALGHALRRIQQEPRYIDTIKLAVFHHPVTSADEDRLRDTGFVERLAQAGFRLALHGHIHRPQPGLFRYDMAADGRRIDFLGAGTFGAPTKEWVPGFPLQYQLLDFDGDRLRVHTRRREELKGTWKPDARWTQGPGQNPLPYYDVEL